MDTTASDIRFDAAGVCSYCIEFEQKKAQLVHRDPVEREARLRQFVERVKRSGRRKRYDCIIGVSGGVDSSWALVKAVQLGLRPLAAHMDNGWNSELAQHNIANLVRSLGVDLYTHVINWEEYRGLMQAFFDADVLDVELLYDNAMMAVNYRQAAAHGVHFILAGTNQATEGMRFPPGWNWLKFDKRNIVDIGRRFGGVRLDTFPAISSLGFAWFELVRRIRWVSFLDFFPYNKEEALTVLETDYGYRRYPFKHYESIFTRFYQGYILPRKFGVDKRRLHFSTLVASGQITRSEALQGVTGLPYPSEAALEQDKRYFLKKMGWTAAQLDGYIARPERSHLEFASEQPLWDRLVCFYRQLFGERARA